MLNSALWTRNDIVREIEGYGPNTTELDYVGTIIGSIFLIRNDGAVLMQLRDNFPGLRHGGLWVPPGGHINPDETLMDGVIRECLEETQLAYEEVNCFNALEVLSPPWPNYLLGIFWAFYNQQPFSCQEGQALQFVEPHNATQFPMPKFVVEIWDRILLLTKPCIARF